MGHRPYPYTFDMYSADVTAYTAAFRASAAASNFDCLASDRLRSTNAGLDVRNVAWCGAE